VVQTININETDEPLVHGGWVQFEGVSVAPQTIYLTAHCDCGEIILNQSVFEFHLPEIIPFDVIIYIPTDTENGTVGTFTVSGYYALGGIQSETPPVTQKYNILNYNETGIAIGSDNIQRPKDLELPKDFPLFQLLQ
jgi:hypothetical protein